MTYAAFGPLGPRIGLAASTDLEHWQRLGPVTFGYQADLRTDLGLYPNKDALLFPEPVPVPTAGRRTRCSTGRCGTCPSSAAAKGTAAGWTGRSAAGHLGQLRAGGRRRGGHRRADQVRAASPGRVAGAALGGAEDRRRDPADLDRGGLARPPPRRHGRLRRDFESSRRSATARGHSSSMRMT